jgi:SAM-dependent methyltransferase
MASDTGGEVSMRVETDKVFAGSIPEIYDTLFVPLIFEPYAEDLVRRLVGLRSGHLLEIAAGTGVVTRAMAAALPPEVKIVATDLNPAMIERGRAVGTARDVEWREADAMRLPFPDASFDAIVCQFGVMFFPDKPKAFAEMRRVLRRGGRLLFNVWDRIEDNEFADVVTESLKALFPDDPPLFMRRTPHGHFDTEALRRDLAAGGFAAPAQIETVSARSRAESPRIPAIAYCQGTPLRNEIVARGASRLEEATDVATQAIAQRFGRGPVDGKIQAIVVSVAG